MNMMEGQPQPLSTIKNKAVFIKEDYISELHDSVIHHIFSFLPIRDVVRCCTLSKRWRSVWTTLPTFSFHHHPHHPFHSVSVGSLMDSFKNSYSSPKLKKLQLDMPFVHGRYLASKISKFLEFAIDRQVEDVSLLFQDEGGFVLPIRFYNDHTNSLQNVSVRRCSFLLSIGSNVNWPSLKALSIGKGPLSDAEITSVLAGCPVLESLKLTECWGMDCIQLNSKSLKELIIAGYDIDTSGIETKIYEDEGENEDSDSDSDYYVEFYDGDDKSYSSEVDPFDEYYDGEYLNDDSVHAFVEPNVPTMEINAPYLQSLRIKGIWRNKVLKLVQAHSLVEAELGFFAVGYDSRVHSYMLRQLYQNLQHVNDLIIEKCNFEELLCEKSFCGLPLFSVEMSEIDKWHLKKLLLP